MAKHLSHLNITLLICQGLCTFSALCSLTTLGDSWVSRIQILSWQLRVRVHDLPQLQTIYIMEVEVESIS